MKGKSLLLMTLSLLLAFSLGGGIGGQKYEARAEGPVAPDEAPLAATVGNVFTYQGRLMKDGSPVNDRCDFRFHLYDDKVGGTLLGTVDIANHSVSDGLFTVELNFGAEAFTGDARWLEIEVRCPTGSGSFVTLTPRQELTATPYAHSLRPGAKVQGAIDVVDEAVLTVENTDIGIGIKVDGGSYGIRSTGYFGVYGDGSIGILGTGAFGVDGYSDSSTGVGVRGTAPVTGTAGIATNTTPPAYGVFGESRASFGGVGVYGLATGDGGTTGVMGVAKSGLGTGVSGEGGFFGVQGIAAGTSVVNYGVYGESQSTSGFGVYGKNANGVAIYADGSGIIKSVAETRLAINPFEIERTAILAANQYLDFTHHWLGYTIIKNTSGSGGRNIYVPAHNLTQLFGSSFKLKSLQVCYDLTSASSYIDATYVYYANMSGGRTELLSNTTNRTSISWTCYTVSTGSPLVIDGPILVYFELNFAGTGDTHAINIGRIVATLVE